MKEIVSDPKLVAYCGLYCGACKRYLQEKCPGWTFDDCTQSKKDQVVVFNHASIDPKGATT